MNGDPFVVLMPTERNMSISLKKSKSLEPRRQCSEASSKSSNISETTRSSITTFDDQNFFSPKTGGTLSTSKTSLFNSSLSSAGSFGSRHEFGLQGFGVTAFRDNFSTSSLRNLGSSFDHFDAADVPLTPVSSMRNLTISNDFDPFGLNDPISFSDHEGTFESFANTDSPFEKAEFGADVFASSSWGTPQKRDTSRRETTVLRGEQRKRSSSEKRRSRRSSGIVSPEVWESFQLVDAKSPRSLARTKASRSSRRPEDTRSKDRESPCDKNPTQRARSVPRSSRRASSSAGVVDVSSRKVSLEVQRPESVEKGTHFRPPRRGSMSQKHEDSTELPVSSQWDVGKSPRSLAQKKTSRSSTRPSDSTCKDAVRPCDKNRARRSRSASRTSRRTSSSSGVMDASSHTESFLELKSPGSVGNGSHFRPPRRGSMGQRTDRDYTELPVSSQCDTGTSPRSLTLKKTSSSSRRPSDSSRKDSKRPCDKNPARRSRSVSRTPRRATTSPGVMDASCHTESFLEFKSPRSVLGKGAHFRPPRRGSLGQGAYSDGTELLSFHSEAGRKSPRSLAQKKTSSGSRRPVDSSRKDSTSREIAPLR